MAAVRSRFDTIRGVAPAIAATALVGALACAGVAHGGVARGGITRGGSARGDSGAARALAARTLSVHDTAKLRLVSADGDTLIEEGRASGTLAGTARVTLSFNGTTTTSHFTFHLKAGSISGRARAKLHSGTGHYESFGGSATITGGSGRYAHISGNGGFYGVLDRNTSNAEVQVIGKLHL